MTSSEDTAIMATPCSSPKLTSDEILGEIVSVSANWRLFGSGLRIGAANLDIIEANHQTAKNNLLSVLQEWEKQTYPSWETVVEVLRSDTLNERVLADRIEVKYVRKNSCSELPPGSCTCTVMSPVYERGRPLVQDYEILNLTRNSATDLLKSCTKHSFIVRYSESLPGHLALSVKSDTSTKHFQIKCEDQKYCVDGTNQAFSSVKELVRYHHENEIDGDAKLQTPYKQSLQRIPGCGLQDRSGGQDSSDATPDPQLKQRGSIEEPRKNLVPMSWHCNCDWGLPVDVIRPHVVRIDSNVYFGGGCSKEVEGGKIYKFSTLEAQWYLVCYCSTRRFGLTKRDGKLITVGGLEGTTNTPSRCVYCFDVDKLRTWRMADLNVARADACTLAYQSNLITIGGLTELQHTIQSTNTIEVLVKDSPSWTILNWVLPVPLYSLSCAIDSQTLYILGGCNSMQITADAFSISLPSLLLSSAPSHQQQELERIPNCPFSGSTAAVVDGTLLAIGGVSSVTHCTSDDVFAYSTTEARWKRVPGNLPAPRFLTSVVQLDAKRIVVVGGCEAQRVVKRTAFVNVP